jgi:GNAT superfamily N-acetyltransferase
LKAFHWIEDSYIQVVQEDYYEAEIVWLYVFDESRGKGVGTRLMNKTIKDADREGVTLLVQPYPFGSYDVDDEKFHPPTLTFRQLCAFYRKFGFRFKNGSKEVMIRHPRK